jgi:hypothetical protein
MKTQEELYAESAERAKGRKYYLEYDARPHPDGIEVGEQQEGYGLSDAILTASILRPEDGSYSIMWLSMEGKTGEQMESAEIWKAWYLLAEKLRADTELSAERRKLCQLLCETVRAVMGLPPIPEEE